VAELALIDHERDAFVSEFDGVCVAKLMRGKRRRRPLRSRVAVRERPRRTIAGRAWGR
jgi:hypothetical protein